MSETVWLVEFTEDGERKRFVTLEEPTGHYRDCATPWRLVPEEPTAAMVTAMGDAFFDAAVGHMPGDLPNVNRPFVRFYRALLAASPQ
jgi:hypothetical protein